MAVNWFEYPLVFARLSISTGMFYGLSLNCEDELLTLLTINPPIQTIDTDLETPKVILPYEKFSRKKRKQGQILLTPDYDEKGEKVIVLYEKYPKSKKSNFNPKSDRISITSEYQKRDDQGVIVTRADLDHHLSD
jgi:hypothetical protein